MLFDEIVIGSGISGLYWIWKSRQTKPTNYLVLEKSDRIGGRIYNIEWYDNQISLGGGIIKATNNHTIKICEELGLELGSTVSEYVMIDWINTQQQNINESQNINELNERKFYKINENIIKYLKRFIIKTNL